eukprot:3052732-Amphidinium_carterae.1
MSIIVKSGEGCIQPKHEMKSHVTASLQLLVVQVIAATQRAATRTSAIQPDQRSLGWGPLKNLNGQDRNTSDKAKRKYSPTDNQYSNHSKNDKHCNCNN